MKKFFLVFIILFNFVQYGQAQVNPHAIGLRLGGNSEIGGAEISYQHGLGENNRLELDLGFGSGRHHSRIQFSAIYQWVWTINGGLNWYIGPGAAVGLHSYDRDHHHYEHHGDNYINVALGGQIGLEYDFNSMGAPLQLSLDARPMWDFVGYNSGLGWGAALGIRYTW